MRSASGMWLARATVPLCLTLTAAGCDEGEFDGAVWRSATATKMDKPVVIGGAECTAIALGTSTGASEGRPSWGKFAIHTVSSGGKLVESVYIKPAGAPADFKLTTDNGELVKKMELTRASFKTPDEVLKVTVDTHEGEVVHLAYWFKEECRAGDPPPNLSKP